MSSYVCRETLQNLEALFQELSYIEEKNDELTAQLENEKMEKKAQEKLVEELSAQVKQLQQEVATLKTNNEAHPVCKSPPFIL